MTSFGKFQLLHAMFPMKYEVSKSFVNYLWALNRLSNKLCHLRESLEKKRLSTNYQQQLTCD